MIIAIVKMKLLFELRTSNYSYPITTSCNWIATVGHLCYTRGNQVCLNWFLFLLFLHIFFPAFRTTYSSVPLHVTFKEKWQF